MRSSGDVQLSGLTTLRLGGPARHLLEAETASELVDAVAEAEREESPVLVLAGGSNLVIADRGWPGTVVAVRSRGVRIEPGTGGGAELTAAAGHDWDELVALTVSERLAGLECLSGIPGSVGATPIQNVGAYGQEVAETIAGVRVYDRRERRIVELPPERCGFAYRDSAFKRSERFLVLEVRFALERSDRARPISYSQLAESLGTGTGSRPPLSEVREAVIELRRSKGMVIDPEDPDSVSAGSFFTNPILTAERFAALQRRAVERLGDGVEPPGWPERDGRVKTSAAWLLQRAGFGPGYGSGRAGVSSKHSLALINRGGATTEELLTLARELRDGVLAAFEVELVPEPTLVGTSL